MLPKKNTSPKKSITNSQSLRKLISIKSVMPSNHVILYRPLLKGIWKDSPLYMSPKKSKLKQQITTAYLLECQNLNLDDTIWCQRCKTTGTIIHWWWERKMVQLLWKISGRFLQKKISIFSYWYSHHFLGIYSNELRKYVHSKTCIWQFIAALFLSSKTWKQPKCC